MRKPGLGIWFAALLLALVLGTYTFDWLAVPVIAAAFAWIRRDDASVPLAASVAGAAAWGLLLAWQSFNGSVFEVARVAGEAMQVGGGPLLGLTLAFPALLAGAAAGVVRGLRG